jgi:hypothetical protein
MRDLVEKGVFLKDYKSSEQKGLISTDRGTRTTLMLTIPRSLVKSYTKDLSLAIFELVIQPVE